jgi:hypothetical protein
MKPAQVKPPISPDLLNQIDVRVGTILSVTDIPNSEKLGRAGSQLRRPQAYCPSRDEAGASQSSRDRRHAGSFRRESCAKKNGRYDLRRYAVRHRLCGWHYSGAGNARSARAGRNEGGIMLTDAPPRRANRARFLESDRIRALDLPQNGRLPAIAKSIESAMKSD